MFPVKVLRSSANSFYQYCQYLLKTVAQQQHRSLISNQYVALH